MEIAELVRTLILADESHNKIIEKVFPGRQVDGAKKLRRYLAYLVKEKGEIS